MNLHEKLQLIQTDIDDLVDTFESLSTEIEQILVLHSAPSNSHNIPSELYGRWEQIPVVISFDDQGFHHEQGSHIWIEEEFNLQVFFKHVTIRDRIPDLPDFIPLDGGEKGNIMMLLFRIYQAQHKLRRRYVERDELKGILLDGYSQAGQRLVSLNKGSNITDDAVGEKTSGDQDAAKKNIIPFDSSYGEYIAEQHEDKWIWLIASQRLIEIFILLNRRGILVLPPTATARTAQSFFSKKKKEKKNGIVKEKMIELNFDSFVTRFKRWRAEEFDFPEDQIDFVRKVIGK